MKKKSFLTLLLTLILIVSQIPVGVFAQTEEEYAEQEEEERDFEPYPFYIETELTEEGYHKLSWSWHGTARRVKFKIYGAPLGEKYRKIAVVNGPELSFVNKVLDDKIWKYFVVPVLYLEDGTRQKMKPSIKSFLVSKGNTKYTNATSIEIKGYDYFWLPKGESYKLTLTITKETEDKKLYSSKKNPKLRYLSSDEGVATVSDGIVTAVSEGWCYIDVITENGLDAFVTVQVEGPVLNPQIDYSFATKEEGIEYRMSNTEFFNGLTQNDLDYRMQKKGATLEEFIEFSKAQIRDFTDQEKEVVDYNMWRLEKDLELKGLTLPEHTSIVFVKTTMEDEPNEYAYTHATQIYLSEYFLEDAKSFGDDGVDPLYYLYHELFHCLTRNNPEFRRDMYEIINFTVQDEEYVIPPSVKEYFYSNPDVEHHNSYATFNINGEDIKCFATAITTKHFETEGDNFHWNSTTALVPIDGTDIYYLPEDASNFYDVFGYNTDYNIDPEECMAENFSMAMYYGVGDLSFFDSPEIIEAIYDYFKK